MSYARSFVITLGLFLASVLTVSSKTKLHLLVMTPTHSPELNQLGWDGGPALVPATRLAAEQINSNDNILPDYELVLIEENTSCHNMPVERQVRFLDVYAKQLLYGVHSVLGVVGPVCSVNAVHLGQLSEPSRYPVTQVTVGTNPVLENRTAFPFTHTTVSSGVIYLKVLKKLADQQGWESIGVIFDATNRYFMSIYAHVPSVFGNISVTAIPVEDSSSIHFHNYRIENEVFKTRKRIFLVLTSQNIADSLMCLFYKYSPELTSEGAQWFFIDRTALYNSNTESNCTKSELEKAFEKTVFLQYELSTNEHKPLNLSGKLYESFNQSYPKTVLAYENETGLNVTDDYSHGRPFAPLLYDIVWVFAKSLDYLVRTNRSNLISQRELGINDRLVLAEAFQEAIGLVSFKGASGTIRFNEPTNTIITYTQVIDGQLVPIGTSGDKFINGTFIEDDFRSLYDRIEPWVASLVLILIGLLLLLTLCLHVLNVWYSKVPTIKATSPRLNNLIFVGCYLLALGMILLTVLNVSELGTSSYQLLGDILCNVYMWLVDIGVTLIVATVLIKTFRIYRIFVHFTKPGGFILKDSILALFIVVLLLPIVILLLVTAATSIHPNKEMHIWNTTVYLLGLNERTRATCQVHIVQELMPQLYVGSLLLISLILSLPLRHINRDFKTIKSISILAFCQILLAWIGYPLIFIASIKGVAWDYHVRYILLICTQAGVMLSSLLLLFAPPVLQMLREKLKRKNLPQLSNRLMHTSNWSVVNSTL